jgi:hypothetical protein
MGEQVVGREAISPQLRYSMLAKRRASWLNFQPRRSFAKTERSGNLFS